MQVFGSSPQNRRRAVLLPLGLLILAIAVFGWGLQYKLSLYQGKDSISHSAPVAKLLSQKERPAAVQPPGDRSEMPTWPVVLVFALPFGLCQAATRYFRSVCCEGEWPPLPICLRVIFVRPPPIALFSL